MVARKNEVPLNICNHNVILDNSLIAYLSVFHTMQFMARINIPFMLNLLLNLPNLFLTIYVGGTISSMINIYKHQL